VFILKGHSKKSQKGRNWRTGKREEAVNAYMMKK
jgi:hypothetical protein